MPSIHLKKLRVALISLWAFGLLGGTTCVVPNSTAAARRLTVSDQSFSFIPPEDSGQPRTNRAGGRRGQLCNNAMPTPSLTLLLPPTNQGTTTAAHPTFLAYLPQTTAQQVFLSLENEDNNYVYHTTFELPEEAGIGSFPIPETAPALESDKYYKGSLAIICGEILDPNDPVIEGWIKRISPDMFIEPQPSQRTPFELGAWYARNGVWFDALQALAELRIAEPDNLDAIAAWKELLQSVGLDTMGTVPLLDPVD